MRRAIIVAALSLVFALSASPCSTFCIARDGEVLFGRNYDFEFGEAYVLVNQRGVKKHSYAGDLQWVTRYGSVTFNQYGKEFPMDGMNEAGLTVALMWLEGTEYPPADARPRLGVLEWIQYQLDNHATVAELIANAETVRIEGGTPIHYLISDRSGASATIEYLDGRLVAHTGSALRSANLTNSRYDESLAYLRGFTGFGGTKKMPSGPGSLERFARTAMLMKQAPGAQTGSARAFSILDSVAQGNTRWSVVYDATNATLSWKTRTSPAVKTLAFADLDFACNSTVRGIDANALTSGDLASSLIAYGAKENLAQLLHAYASTSFLQSVPREAIERTAAHADSFGCASGNRRRATRR